MKLTRLCKHNPLRPARPSTAAPQCHSTAAPPCQPQRPNVISSEAEKSKPAVGSRGTYGSPALALHPSLSRLSGAGRNPGERGDARMKESTDETNPLRRPGLPPQRPNVIPPQRPGPYGCHSTAAPQCHFERSREIQARGWQSRHIWLPCARTSPVPLPSFRRRPEPSGARGRANEGINR